MKPEICQLVQVEERPQQMRLYAVCISVDCQGDFELSGHQWRVVVGVQAFSSEDAHDAARVSFPKLKYHRMMATDYPPALDVLSSRQQTLLA